MNWILLVQVLSTLAGSVFVAWLSIMKFHHDLKVEEAKNVDISKSKDVMGMREFFEANVKFRDELRKDYESLKENLRIKNEETEKAWTRCRECDIEREKQRIEIANLNVVVYDLECSFSEFRINCETNHKNVN